jgi:hypothetical protein
MKLAILGMGLAAVLVLSGCRVTTPDYRLSTRSTTVELPDEESARFFQENLPMQLPVVPADLRVEPGPGVTRVFVKGIADPSQRKQVLDSVAQMNTGRAFAPATVLFVE